MAFVLPVALPSIASGLPASPQGRQFQVNTFTTNYQQPAEVALDEGGDFVVVWTSEGSAGTDSSTCSGQGQRFSIQIFAEGFESGDVSARSITIP